MRHPAEVNFTATGGIEMTIDGGRKPEGNGVAERFIRTLKENLLWVRAFDTIEELRQALQEFADHYNENWLVARHGYQTPTQVRAAQLRVANANVGELSLAA
jgi:putative transposase